MGTKALITKKNIEDMLGRMGTDADPTIVRKRAFELIKGSKDGDQFSPNDTSLVRAMSLSEFTNGILLSTGVSMRSRTFAIDLMRRFQKVYACETHSEKATAELAAASYVRALDIQSILSNFINKDSYGDLTIRAISVLGKELDRANRHYLTAIQALRILKQPSVQLNIRADTAVVGQNQAVQVKND